MPCRCGAASHSRASRRSVRAACRCPPPASVDVDAGEVVVERRRSCRRRAAGPRRARARRAAQSRSGLGSRARRVRVAAIAAGDRRRRVHDERSPARRGDGEGRRTWRARRGRRPSDTSSRTSSRPATAHLGRLVRFERRDRAGSDSADSSVAVMTSPPTSRYATAGLDRRRSSATRPGHDRSGSGRSEMSSPGNASWCISVRMSPGSTTSDPQLGMLGGEDRRELLERGLRRAVPAPALVGLDRGVGRDVHDRAAARREQAEQRLDQRERRDDVDLVDPCAARRGRSRRAAGSGLAPSVLALFTSRSRRPSRCTAATSSARWRGSATSPGIETTSVLARTTGCGGSRRSARRASTTSAQPRAAERLGERPARAPATPR